jgi:hypothetical protein
MAHTAPAATNKPAVPKVRIRVRGDTLRKYIADDRTDQTIVTTDFTGPSRSDHRPADRHDVSAETWRASGFWPLSPRSSRDSAPVVESPTRRSERSSTQRP